jgi:hypothetical protein
VTRKSLFSFQEKNPTGILFFSDFLTSGLFEQQVFEKARFYMTLAVEGD